MRKIGVVISPKPVNEEYSGLFKTCFLILDEDNILHVIPKNKEALVQNLSVVVFEDLEIDSQTALLSPIKFSAYYDSHTIGNYNNNGRHIEKYTHSDLTITDPFVHYGGDPKWYLYACDDRLLDVITFQNAYLNTIDDHQGENKKTSRLLSPMVKNWIDFFVVNRKHYLRPLTASKTISLIESITQRIENLDISQVFESYRIEITYHHISRIGRDDKYYEDKTYSIMYHDSYLDQWFKTGSERLHSDSGYTSHFERENEYKRFIDEENEAKTKAYLEYNKTEHLKALIKSSFASLKTQFTTPQPDYISLKTLNGVIPLKKIYYWVDTYLGKGLYSSKDAITAFNHHYQSNPPSL